MQPGIQPAGCLGSLSLGDAFVTGIDGGEDLVELLLQPKV